ncbi:hypothetical protein HOA91_02335 [Candidatus Woesearchaeota archaeon]|jgi:hypothetical protein|nr:hypothetical protein [Candidatus Woesearchaeota archaeon]
MANDLMGLTAILGAMIGVLLLFGIAFYVYVALALMAVAKRLNDPQPWLAWIPVGNMVLMARLAKMHWWPVLLLTTILIMWIPVVGQVIYFIAIIIFSIFTIIWQWKICEARDHPGWWVLLTFIPIVGMVWYFIMWGILAWGE